MEKQDLRVKKTLKSIEEAFIKLLAKKPLEKITITELAAAAEINKGTFYLHYTDIYDLYTQILHDYISKPIIESNFYPDLFDDPELFLEKLNTSLYENLSSIDRITSGIKERVDYEYFINLLIDKVYETKRIPKTTENDMKLWSFFCSLITLNIQYHGKHADQMKDLALEIINTFFPMKKE